MHFPDDEQFDRLADGELTAAERRELLDSLDDRDDGWRRCALALLEAQAFQAQLKSYVVQVDQDPRKATLPAPQQPTGRSAAAVWWTVAAALVMAFGAGRFVRPPRGDMAVVEGADRGVESIENIAATGPEPNSEALPEALVQIEPAPPGKLATRDDSLTLLVRDVHGKAQRVQLPLMESGQLDQRLGTTRRWSPSAGFVEQLRESGLDLQTRRRYAPVFFERPDGIVPMVVPVDDAYLRPVRQQIY